MNSTERQAIAISYQRLWGVGSVTDMQIRARGAAEGSVILALHGEIDAANVDEVEAQFDALLVSTTGDVRIDCSAIEYIDLTGFDALVRVHHELAHRGRRLILTRTTPRIRQLLEITALDRLFVLE